MRTASRNVVRSGAVGPDPITPRSSPPTSERMSVSTEAVVAAASRPPLIAERCLRTALTSTIVAPERRSSCVVRCLSASVSPAAGKGRRLEAPPDRSTINRSSLSREEASCSTRRAACTPLRSGIGWPASATAIPDFARPGTGDGATTNTESSRPRRTSCTACAMGLRPCPRRWRPPVQCGASHTGGRPRAGSDAAASMPAERRGRGRPRRARPAGCDATLPRWVRMEGSVRLVRLLARHRTAIVRAPRDLDLVCPARQIVLTDLWVEELQLEEISAELLRHGGQMAPILLDVDRHHFGVQRRVEIGFRHAQVLIRLGEDLLARDDAGHVAHGLRGVVQLPVVVDPLLAHGLPDVHLAGVIGRDGPGRVAKNVVQPLQELDGGLGRELEIAAVVLPVVVLQREEPAGRGDELPGPGCFGP